jgi:hypothetical protein
MLLSGLGARGEHERGSARGGSRWCSPRAPRPPPVAEVVHRLHQHRFRPIRGRDRPFPTQSEMSYHASNSKRSGLVGRRVLVERGEVAPRGGRLRTPGGGVAPRARRAVRGAKWADSGPVIASSGAIGAPGPLWHHFGRSCGANSQLPGALGLGRAGADPAAQPRPPGHATMRDQLRRDHKINGGSRLRLACVPAAGGFGALVVRPTATVRPCPRSPTSWPNPATSSSPG